MPDQNSILVVEDNDFVRMQLIRFLEEGGYLVHEASDGLAALEILRTQKVDVIILDLRMTPMDGIELVKTIQSQGLMKPVIVVTGDNNPDLLAEASRWHMSAVLMKPVQKDRLLKMVSRAIAQLNRH
jgi:CheY-like chemotaxis protein